MSGFGVPRRVVPVAVALLVVAACRPVGTPRPHTAAEAPIRARAARGAVLYAGYCAGCHGADGDSVGPVAALLQLRPAHLRDPAVLAADDRALVGALLGDEPLVISPRRNAVAEDLQVKALLEYLPNLSSQNWPRVRAGRFAYESSCAPCHGTYGTGEGVLGSWGDRPPADLHDAGRRYTDAGLEGVMRHGVGYMPPMGDLLPPAERRAIVAYVRILSPAYRAYDTYCAGCHGDDGRGVDPEDLAAPEVAGPPIDPAALAGLDPAERRARVLHMFRREHGLMPHFRDTLEEPELRDIFAYLRSGAS